MMDRQNLPPIYQIRAWEAGELYPEHDTFSFGHGFGTALVEAFDYLEAQRDAAAQVATTSFRAALTEPTTTKGPSLAELAQVEVEGRANFRIQDDIADVLTRWTVPPAHRPTCPLDQKPCTHWSCLVDVCVDAKKDVRFDYEKRAGGRSEGGDR